MRLGIQAPVSKFQDGGGFTFEWDLLRALLEVADARGHEVTLVAQEARPSEPDWIRSRDWLDLTPKVLGSTGWKRWAKSIPGAQTAVRIARSRRRGSSEGKDAAAREAAGVPIRQAGIRFLIHTGPFAVCTSVPFSTVVWDVEHRRLPFFPDLTGRGQWDVRERFYRQVLPRAAFVIVGTQVGKGQIREFYGVADERFLILPHPTPEDSFQTTRPPAATWVPDRPFLIYPAQFWPHKNHVGLLRALAVLRDSRGLRPQLVFTGSDKGNLGHVAGEIAALGLQEQVTCAGFVERQDLLGAYDRATAMTYLSYGGPENLPPLEAFARGCPVVAADVPGAREQLGEAAILVDPTNPDQIAQGISRVMQDGAFRDAMVARGRERARRWGSIDFANGLIDAIQRLEPQIACWDGRS
jgi:glycosyltransferase involved in cell wall biosynthesis